MERKYPVIIFEKHRIPEERALSGTASVTREVEVGTAFIDDDDKSTIRVDLNGSPWGRAIASNIHYFWAGLCQASREAEVKLALSPKKAYASRQAQG